MDQVDMEQKILRNLRESVMEEMDFSSEISDEKLFARIDYALMRESRKRLLSIEERTRLRRRVFDSFRRLDILQELLEDESVTEIMVNGMESSMCVINKSEPTRHAPIAYGVLCL